MTHDTSLTTTSILALFQTTKEERQSFVSDVLSKIESGDVDPLKIHLQVKCTEDVMKLLTSNSIYREAVVAEAEKQGKKTFDFHNSKFELKEVGVKYDWSKCEDPVLTELLATQAGLECEIKARQGMLKTVNPKEGLTITDKDSGETFTVYPPAKSSTTNVAVTLK